MEKEMKKNPDYNGVLYSISRDITAVQSVPELLETIFLKLKKVIDFDDVGLFHVLEDGRHRDLTAASEIKLGANKIINENLGDKWLIAEDSFNAIVEKLRIERLNNFFERYHKHPHTEFLRNEGLRQFISTPLKRSDKVFGAFILWSKKENIYSKKDIPLFTKIVDIVALTLSNILDREAILKQNFINESLLKISEAIAAVSNVQELLQIINNQVRLLIPFDDSGLFHVLPDGRHKDFMVDFLHDKSLSKKLKETGIAGYLDSESSITNALMATQLFNEKELRTHLKKHPHFAELKKRKAKQVFSTPLLIAGKPIGFFNLVSLTSDVYSMKDFPLFESLADFIALALNNLIVKEELLAEKQFKETLLDISEAVSTLQSGNRLLRLIFDKIRPIYNFYDVGLFVFNEDRTALEDWSLKYNDLALSPESQNALNDQAVNKPLTIEEGSNMAWELSLLEKEDSPVIIDLTDMAKRFPEYEQSQYLIKAGYHDSMQVLLKYAGEKLGFFCINAKQKDFFDKSHYPLFQAISDQLAVAVRNILDNQKLIKEKQFKETLLGISESVNSIRSREDLYHAIMSDLSPIVQYADAVLCLINPATGRHIQPLTMSPDSTINHPLYKEVVEKELETVNTPIENALKGSDVDYFKLSTWLEKYPEYPGLHLMRDIGLNYSTTLLLKHQEVTMGILFFHFKTKQTLNAFKTKLYANIRSQFSVALSKILAQEKLEKETQFKETLLGISDAMATIVERKDLLATIVDYLKPIVTVDDLGVIVYNEERTHWRDLTVSEEFLEVSTVSNALYEQNLDKWIPFCSLTERMQLTPLRIWTIEEFLSHDDFAFRDILANANQEEFITAPLKSGNAIIGVLVLVSYQAGAYYEHQLPLMQQLTDQIGPAVQNILSTEKLLDEKNFKETLLEISESVSTVGNKEELLQIVFNKLKPLFDFHDTGLFVLGNNDLEVTDWSVAFESVDPSNSNTELQSENFSIIPYPGSGMEWAIQDILEKKRPVIHNFERLSKTFPEWPHFPILLKHGIKEGLSTVLVNGGKVIGMLSFNAKTEGHFGEHHIPMFNAIADLLAVAVSNVSSKESLLAEKNFKETLLGISESVASIQDRSKLLKVVFEKIQPILPFDAPGLFIINGPEHYEILDGQVTTDAHNESVWKKTGTGPFKNKHTLVQQVIDTPKTYIAKVQDVSHPHIPTMLETGLQQMMYGPLKNRGIVIGLFILNSKNSRQYSEGQRILFEAITDQLAVAVSNVLANEGLIVEKTFKETLLNISESVSVVKDRGELLQIIFGKLKPIFKFHGTGLFVLGNEDTEVTDWSVAVEKADPSQNNLVLRARNFSTMAYPNSALEWAIQDIQKKGGPVIYDYARLAKEFPKWPHFSVLLEHGNKECLSTVLVNGGKVIGLLNFNAKSQGHFGEHHIPMFNAIADLLAVAVSNVSSKESLLAEKNFKETLLGISEAVLEVYDRKQLLKLIFDRLKTIITFDHAGLFIIDYHRDVFFEILEEGTLDELQDEQARNNNLGPFPYSGNHPKAIMYIEEISILDIKEHSKIYTNSQVKPMLAAGFKKVMVAPLKHNNKRFGFLCFVSKNKNQFTPDLFPLVNAIANQVSIAVNNVLANESLLAEKNFKETLLAISEAVASIQDRKELFKVIFDKINPVIPIDDVGILLLNEEGTKVKDLATIDNYYDSQLGRNMQKQGLGNFFDIDPFAKLALRTTGIVSKKALRKKFPKNETIKLLTNPEFPINEFMYTPMRVGNSLLGALFFDSKVEGTYSETMFPLFRAIADQLAVAVSNVLANENILEREQEKATLLDITSAVSKIRNLPDFLSFVTKKLKPIFNFIDVGIFLLTDNGQYHYDMAGLNEEISSSPINSALLAKGNKPILHKDSLIDWMMSEIEKQNGPVLFDFVQLVKDFPDYYQFTIVDTANSGYRDCLAANLKIGENAFGMFCINALTKKFFKKEQFSLFKNVTEQLSVAISNILANQKMEEEKKYSENLLEITEALAATTNAVELYKAIDTVVKKIIPFDQVGVLILDKSDAYHYELINENFVNHVSDKGQTYISAPKQHLYRHKGTSVEWLANNGPVITSMDFLVKNTEHPRHIDMVNAGVKELLGGPLINQGKPIGMMAFKLKKEGVFNETHIKHYKSVAEQVSICVANILSKKEILWKSSIQDLELKISNILTAEQLSSDKWADIFQELQTMIPFTLATVIKVSNGDIKNFTYEWITPYEMRQLSAKNVAEITKLSAAQIKKSQKALFQLSKKEDVLTDSNHIPPAVKSYMEAMGLKSVLPHKMYLKKKNTEVYFFMFGKNKDQFSIRHVNILEGIRNTLRISLENMFSSFSIKEMSEQLKLEKSYLESVVKETYNFENMVGESKAMREVFSQVSEVATVDATTLILGETGTGKELIARAIHENSSRKDRVLVKVNCAAIPSQIVESELFGHQRGAFTGAVKDRIGKFELANKGTIFLDEIGEMPLELQTKLLRVIQEREVERLGSNVTIPLDIRIIAATNRNLNEDITTGIFRSDLFYRLNGYPIQVPPLRARGEDVLLLADFFARQFSEQYGLPFKGFTANTLKRFQAYDWPGNVRELQNNIEQAIISQKGKIIEIHPGNPNVSDFKWMTSENGHREKIGATENLDMDTIKREKEQLERGYLLDILEKKKWKVSGKNGAARQLGIAPSTLESRMRKLGITRN